MTWEAREKKDRQIYAPFPCAETLAKFCIYSFLDLCSPTTTSTFSFDFPTLDDCLLIHRGILRVLVYLFFVNGTPLSDFGCLAVIFK